MVIVQLIVNTLVASGLIFIMAVGFALIYRVSRFFHFAHGVVFTSGPYLAFLFCSLLKLSPFISVFFAVILSIILGSVIELSIYRPLRCKGASTLVLLIASLGTYIALQNVISFLFGDDAKSIRSPVVEKGINCFGAFITQSQVFTICLSIFLGFTVGFFLKKTRIGKTLRSVGNAPQLAEVCGIDSNRIILWTFALGSALAGIAGILVALDVDMTPTMGMNALLMGVVAVIIGGMGSIPGIALGALLLGMAQQFGAWNVGSQWQEAITFVILLIFLLFRPQGFLGKKVKTATL